MDHTAFLASLTPQQRRSLTERRNGPGAIHLGIHAGSIGVLGVLIATGIPYWWALMLPQGVLLVFLFTLLHESLHRTVFANDRWNDAIAWFCGVLLFLPRNWFRYFHFAHHRHTHDPLRDPECAIPKPATLPAYLWYLTGLSTWSAQLTTLLRNARSGGGDVFVPARARDGTRREARVMLAIYASAAIISVASGSAVLVWTWLLPLLLGQPFLRLYLMAEHTGCPHVSDMFANSRTVLADRILCKLAWNMPFHAEHHAYPTVPYHRLPELHRLAQAHLKTVATGYVDFHADHVRDLRHA